MIDPSDLKSSGKTQNTPLPHHSHRQSRDQPQEGYGRNPHRPCLQQTDKWKVTSRKITILFTHSPLTHAHPIILFRGGRGNPSDERIKEVSIKMVFRLGLEIWVLIIHEGGKQPELPAR